jgi:hypothetical protein
MKRRNVYGMHHAILGKLLALTDATVLASRAASPTECR